MEQRKYQRFADSSLVMFSSETLRGEGRLDDLSLGGAAILSEIAISRGECLSLTITLPTQAAIVEIELAPVRWVKEGSLGVEFIRIAQDHNNSSNSISTPWKVPRPKPPNAFSHSSASQKIAEFSMARLSMGQRAPLN
jgi:PilZ domain